LKKHITILFFLLLVSPLFLTLVSCSPVNVAQKVALIKFADIVWIKVSVLVPQSLVATDEYNISLRVRVVEVDGSLSKFIIKGIKVTIGNEYVEYVPDKPIELKDIGDEGGATIEISPRIFALNLAPGDVKDTSIKIDFAYYLEGKDIKDNEVIESGLYTIFANIPIRIVVPRTYVYVQPKLIISYEPSYIVNFTVRIWVEGEGFVENVKVEVSGAPVQCYLMTTGRLCAGESKVLWTIMNVTELGMLAEEQYSPVISVYATTPWGYVYKYTYPLRLKLLKVRRVSASLPESVIAYAYAPVLISLTPKPEAKERVIVTVSFNGEPVYSTTYPTQYLPLAFSEGTGLVKITLSSEEQAPASILWKISAIRVKPGLNVMFSPASRRLSIEVRPLFVNSKVAISVIDKEGNVVFVQSIPESALIKSQTSVEGVITLKGSVTIRLPELKAGEYVVRVTYDTPLGSVSEDLKYTVKGEGLLDQLSSALSFIPLPAPLNLALVVIIIATTVACVMIALSKRRKAKGEEEGESSEW